jgi:hypothetical protein
MTAFTRILFCTALGLGSLGLGTRLAGGNFVSQAKANPDPVQAALLKMKSIYRDSRRTGPLH